MQKKLILDSELLDITISRLCQQLIENHNDFSDSVIIGMQPRGIFVADILHRKLEADIKKQIPLGYLDATFYRDDFRRRETPVKANETRIPFIIEGKNVVIVDDSIVRGTSSASIIKTLRSARAKKINMLVTYPPIRYPCYAGIDFPSQKELLAYQQSNGDISKTDLEAKVARVIGADFVAYNNTSNLADAIGLAKEELCFTCTTGDYSSLGLKPIFKTREEMKGEE